MQPRWLEWYSRHMYCEKAAGASARAFITSFPRSRDVAPSACTALLSADRHSLGVETQVVVGTRGNRFDRWLDGGGLTGEWARRWGTRMPGGVSSESRMSPAPEFVVEQPPGVSGSLRFPSPRRAYVDRYILR